MTASSPSPTDIAADVWLGPALAVVFGLALCAAGAALLAALPRRLRPGTGDTADERLLVAFGLGAAASGPLLFAVAGLGLLRPPVVLALVLGALGGGALVSRRGRAGVPTTRDLGRLPATSWRPSWRHRVLVALLLLPVAALTLDPTIGFDAGTYHLPTARAMAEAGSLVVLPLLRFPLFPQAAEVLFAAGRVLGGGDVVARCLQLLFLLATAGVARAWGHDRSRRVGSWCAALWLGTPLAVWIGTRAYVDVQLAFFTTLALWALERATATETAPVETAPVETAPAEPDPDETHDAWWLVAGAAAGGAAAVKYLGLFFVAVVGISALAASLRRRTVGPTLLVSATAALVAGPWYLRLVAVTGSPVFPFYQGLFGANEWSSAHDETLHGLLAGGPLDAVRDGVLFLLATPWRSLAVRHVFDFQAPLTPWLVVLPPLVVAALVVAALLPRRFVPGRRALHALRRQDLRLLAVVVAYLLFWLTTVRDLRFLLPILPAVGLLLASALDSVLDTLFVSLLDTKHGARRRLVASGLALALLAPGPAYAVYKLAELGPPPLTVGARLERLDRNLPGHAALRHLDDAHEPGYVVFGLDTERLTSAPRRGRHVGALFGPAAVGPVRKAPDGAALVDRLRAFDACYLLSSDRLRAALRLQRRDGFDEHLRVDHRADGYTLFAVVDPACPGPSHDAPSRR